jgi:hypothetical protein
MPPPKYDRQAWEDELKELPALLAKLHRELAAASDELVANRAEQAGLRIAEVPRSLLAKLARLFRLGRQGQAAAEEEELI